MTTSIFDNKIKKPMDSDISEVLGPKKRLWDELISHLEKNYLTINEWKFYSKKSGWTLVIKEEKRNLLILIPCSGHFLVHLVFGQKAVRIAEKSDISSNIIGRLLESNKIFGQI